MIGISSDSRADEQKWRDYISQIKMEWVHFLDLRHQVINAFQIDAYPTGVVIGPDGIMLLREIGGGIATKGTLEDAIKKGLKMLEAK